MAVFSTNLTLYTHVDFEQTFVLENSSTNSALDLTDYTGVSRFKRQFASGGIRGFNVSFTNRESGKVRLTLSASETSVIPPGKYFYDIVLTDGAGKKERVIEGIVLVKQPVTWPSPPPENPFVPQVP